MTINIALIRQEQTGGDGGAQAIIDLMLKALEQKSAVNISLLCRKWESDQHNAKKIIIDPPFKGRKAKQSSFNNAVTEYISKNSFDLVQSHERFSGCHIFRAGDGVHKVWLQQKALISNPLQTWWLQRSNYHKALLIEEQKMFENPSLKKVICNSQMVKQEILDNFKINKDKIDVIYNGVDTHSFTPATATQKQQIRKELNIPSNALVFIFSGSGFERKNLSTTLKAFAQLPNDAESQAYLIIAGRDKKQAYYEKLSQRLSCHQRVLFLGAQEKARMPSLYHAADVLVLPTLYDPFANVILEGLASGLPCITSSNCGAIDIIPKYPCGQIVHPLDQLALTQAMASYSDTKKRESESQCARTTAQQFTQQKMQKNLLTLYSKLLEN